MAFNFKLDAGGNLITEARQEAVQESAQPSTYGFQVDESGEVRAGLAQPGMEIAQQYQAQTQVPEVPGTWAEIRDTVTGELRETPQTEGLPELSLDLEAYAKDPISAIKTTAGLLITSDEEGRKNVLKKWNPDIKIEKDSKGNEIVTMPDGEQAVLNKPGFSKGDAYRLLFDAAFFAPSAMAPGAGTAASAAGRGALKKAVIGGVAAGATEAGRQQLSQALGTGEDTDLGRIGMTALTGAAAEYIPAKLKARKTKKVEKELGVDIAQSQNLEKNVARAEDIKELSGLETLRAQKTGSLKDLERQSMLATESEVAQDALRAQNKNATKSVASFVRSVSKPGKDTARRARDAASKAIEDLESVRTTAASPYYKKAVQDPKFYSVGKTKEFIKGELKDLPTDDPYRKALLSIEDNLDPRNIGGAKGSRGLRMKQLDRVYKNIGNRITRAWKDGDTALVGQLTGVRETLGKQMDDFNSFYKQGREAYKKLSPQVDDLKNSIVGDVSRLKDQQLKQLRKKFFDKELFEADPKQISKARSTISKKDPKVWNELVREEFKSRILSKMSATQGEMMFSVKNKPGQFYRAIFGKGGKDRAVLYSALGGEQKKRLRYIEEGLIRQSAGRPGGSQTAIRETIKDEFKEGAPSSFAKLLSPRETLQGAAEQAMIARNKEAAASLMFDPKWNGDWKALRKLTPNSKQASRKMSNMVKQALKASVVSQSPESPAATRRALEILNKEE